jgi:hypothetical protein
MRGVIAILEDNADRIAAMDDCLADKFPFFERQFLRTADAAINWLDHHLPNVVCISFDHDLEPMCGATTDPGTGRMVADFLASSRPIRPLIIHTTNRPAADGMEMALLDGGWPVERVLPYDDCRWIAEAWLPLVRHAIVDAAAIQRDALPTKVSS